MKRIGNLMLGGIVFVCANLCLSFIVGAQEYNQYYGNPMLDDYGGEPVLNDGQVIDQLKNNAYGNNNSQGNEGNSTSEEGNKCNGIKLNTDFPLVGDCIGLKKGEGKVNALNVFQTMLGSLMRIVSSIILVVCFIMIILAGIKWSANDPKGATDLIKKVAITVLLLGLSGVILKVINPTFFS